jgi:hypothetical protein
MNWRSLAPAWARKAGRAAQYGLLAVLLRGRSRCCPVCERRAARFLPYGAVRRENAMCPHCGALERHRFVWLYLTRRSGLFVGGAKTLLHLAPEPCLERRLRRQLGEGYLSADLSNPRAMVNADIMALPFADGRFDVVYCSHVLEHVADDRLALREIRRVLGAGGWALILVPVYPGPTLEDPGVTDPRERFRRFGQEDHLRRYGEDFPERLRQAGFVVTAVRPGEICADEEIARMGLNAAAILFHCRRG